jgi:hypothetical protein
MGDPFTVGDGDLAGARRHGRSKISSSLFIRHSISGFSAWNTRACGEVSDVTLNENIADSRAQPTTTSLDGPLTDAQLPNMSSTHILAGFCDRNFWSVPNLRSPDGLDVNYGQPPLD